MGYNNGQEYNRNDRNIYAVNGRRYDVRGLHEGGLSKSYSQERTEETPQ